MDRRWTGPDYERDSNSSEKKLIPVSNTVSSFVPSARDNNSTQSNAVVEENEYAYIDRKSLSTFSGFHSIGNGLDHQQHISPEPYATTDILRTSKSVASNVAMHSSNDKNNSLRKGGSQTQLYAVRFLSIHSCIKIKMSWDDFPKLPYCILMQTTKTKT